MTELGIIDFIAKKNNECHHFGKIYKEIVRLQLRTTVGVSKGGELFSSYTSSLQPTIVRREKLRQHKYFECKCARCTDPTELGTHLGTLKCTKCDNGIIISTNPLGNYQFPISVRLRSFVQMSGK